MKAKVQLQDAVLKRKKFIIVADKEIFSVIEDLAYTGELKKMKKHA